MTSNTQTSMVERVAKVLYATASGDERPDFARQPQSVKQFYFQQARVAIEAMREPTEAMTKAGGFSLLKTNLTRTAEQAAMASYASMLSAALSEEQTETPGDQPGRPLVRT